MNNTVCPLISLRILLWFAYKLVSLNYWIQLHIGLFVAVLVVICLQISIFELLNTTHYVQMIDIAIVERWFRNKKRDFWQESDTVFTGNPIPDFCIGVLKKIRILVYDIY